MNTLSSRRYGSVVNAITDASAADSTVERGALATLLLWSDRVPMVITDVVRFKSGQRKGKVRLVKARKLHVEWDRTKPGGIGHQNWVIHTDRPYGDEVEFHADMAGALRTKFSHGRLVVGKADYYYDWSF